MRIKYKGKSFEVPTYDTAAAQNTQQNASAVVTTTNSFSPLRTLDSNESLADDVASIADVIDDSELDEDTNSH